QRQCRFGKDAVVVAGAGNRGSEFPEFPAAEAKEVKGVISVAATNQYDQLAPFSNFGGWVWVAAPGEGITSSVPPNQYATWRGTSMSAPIVAGQVALVKSRFRGFNAADIVNHITSTGDSINGPVPKRINIAYSLGLK
nr:S8 family serine peptidase [Pyrinomonadaceae bacterium]